MRARSFLVLAVAGTSAYAATTCPDICSADYSPVCGTDGAFYTNLCQLQIAACKCDFCIRILKLCEETCGLASATANSQCSQIIDGECVLTTCEEFTTADPGELSTASGNVPTSSSMQDLILTASLSMSTVDVADSIDITNLLSSSQDISTTTSGALASATLTRTVTSSGPAVEPTNNGEAAECDSECSEEIMPLCASNGMVYQNECKFKQAQCNSLTPLTAMENEYCMQASAVSLTESPSNGAEDCIQACPPTIEPVCGSDGKTYENMCAFKNAQCIASSPLTIISLRSCPAAPSQTGMIDMPPEVIDNIATVIDRTTILIESVATVIDMTTTMIGTTTTIVDLVTTSIDSATVIMTPIPSTQTCPKEKNPVCGSDGLTYLNLCLLEYVAKTTKITAVRYGMCADKVDVHDQSLLTPTATIYPNNCNDNLAPVCGSDGQTYNNACLLRLHANQNGIALKVMYKGNCTES